MASRASSSVATTTCTRVASRDSRWAARFAGIAGRGACATPVCQISLRFDMSPRVATLHHKQVNCAWREAVDMRSPRARRKAGWTTPRRASPQGASSNSADGVSAACPRRRRLGGRSVAESLPADEPSPGCRLTRSPKRVPARRRCRAQHSKRFLAQQRHRRRWPPRWAHRPPARRTAVGTDVAGVEPGVEDIVPVATVQVVDSGTALQFVLPVAAEEAIVAIAAAEHVVAAETDEDLPTLSATSSASSPCRTPPGRSRRGRHSREVDVGVASGPPLSPGPADGPAARGQPTSRDPPRHLAGSRRPHPPAGLARPEATTSDTTGCGKHRRSAVQV